MGEKVRGVLGEFEKAVEAEVDIKSDQIADEQEERTLSQNELRKEAQRGMWDAMDEILGH